MSHSPLNKSNPLLGDVIFMFSPVSTSTWHENNVKKRNAFDLIAIAFLCRQDPLIATRVQIYKSTIHVFCGCKLPSQLLLKPCVIIERKQNKYYLKMRSLLLNLFLLVSGFSCISAAAPFSRGLSSSSVSPSLFGIRGGGLFGGKDDEKK